MIETRYTCGMCEGFGRLSDVKYEPNGSYAYTPDPNGSTLCMGCGGVGTTSIPSYHGTFVLTEDEETTE